MEMAFVPDEKDYGENPEHRDGNHWRRAGRLQPTGRIKFFQKLSLLVYFKPELLQRPVAAFIAVILFHEYSFFKQDTQPEFKTNCKELSCHFLHPFISIPHKKTPARNRCL